MATNLQPVKPNKTVNMSEVDMLDDPLNILGDDGAERDFAKASPGKKTPKASVHPVSPLNVSLSHLSVSPILGYHPGR